MISFKSMIRANQTVESKAFDALTVPCPELIAQKKEYVDYLQNNFNPK